MKPYAQANHPPKVVIDGGLDRKAVRGTTFTIDASQSSDPDGNTLRYKFWQYADADNTTATGDLLLRDFSEDPVYNFSVPNESGKYVNLIVEVRDNGTPNLTALTRAVALFCASFGVASASGKGQVKESGRTVA